MSKQNTDMSECPKIVAEEVSSVTAGASSSFWFFSVVVDVVAGSVTITQCYYYPVLLLLRGSIVVSRFKPKDSMRKQLKKLSLVVE